MKSSYQKLFLVAAIGKISIVLLHEMVAIIREAVEQGEYASSSEVILTQMMNRSGGGLSTS